MRKELLELRPGRKLMIRTGGQANHATVFMIHGAGGRGEQWQNQVSALAPENRIIVPDLLGHGASPRPKHGYHFSEIAADLEALFRKYKTKQNIIVGHSYGTAFALWLTAKFPEEVKRSVLIGAATLRAASGSSVWKLPVFILKMLQPKMSRSFADGAFHPSADQEFVARERAISDQNSLAMMKRLFRGMHYKGDRDLSQIRQPVLIINGEADRLTPVAAAQELCGQLPDCRLEVVEKASHLVMMEKPEEVNGLIMNFITTG